MWRKKPKTIETDLTKGDGKMKDTASLWSHTTQRQKAAPLDGDRSTDVLVIGGGLAGVLTAHALKRRGIPSLLVEAQAIGSGATHNTTAKITAQHGLIYDALIRKFGVEKAGLYYQANRNAVARFRELAMECPCDFEPTTAYTYVCDDAKKLEREHEAYQKLGIRGEVRKALPFPIPALGAIGMPDQAQFHPLKLLYALADELEICESTFVERLDGMRAVTKHGSITAKHIVLATHFPLVNIPGGYFLKLYQHRSYVIALQNAARLDGVYVDDRKDGFSFRNHGEFLLIGGGDHRTGKSGGGWQVIRDFAQSAYPDARETYAWAAQDCMSLDGMPYIGALTKSMPHVFVASGFNKWGMTGSMVAAQVLADRIACGKSDLDELFSPQRSILRPQLALNGLDATVGLLSLGKRCPHMGCALHWNETERSWDCHCHGSRFDESGRLLDNPAKRNKEGIRP